jgi:HrpA-like RNA helicase
MLLEYLNADDSGFCGVLSLDTRVYPVQEYFLEQPCKDYISQAVETIFNIHKTEPMGDILAFVPGREDVDTIVELIHDRAQEFFLIDLVPNFRCCPFHCIEECMCRMSSWPQSQQGPTLEK